MVQKSKIKTIFLQFQNKIGEVWNWGKLERKYVWGESGCNGVNKTKFLQSIDTQHQINFDSMEV